MFRVNIKKKSGGRLGISLFSQRIRECLRLLHQLSSASNESKNRDTNLSNAEQPTPQVWTASQCCDRTKGDVLSLIQGED